MRIKNFSLRRGFTLIELIIFMGILSILLLLLSTLFTSVINVQLESEGYSSIDTDGRYILAKLMYAFQSADSADTVNNYIDTPATGSAGQTLKVKINSVLYTYSGSTSGTLQLLTPTLNNLTSSESSISGLLFQRIGPGGNIDTIQVSFRLTSKIKRANISKFRDFQTSVSMP